MTPALGQTQWNTLKTLAMADPTAAGYIAAGDDTSLAAWFNTAADGPVKAWPHNAMRRDLFEAMDLDAFDALTQGKRDAWRLLMENAGSQGIDFRRQKSLDSITSCWAAGSRVALAQALQVDATRAENALGGTSMSPTNVLVSGLARNYVGTVSVGEASLIRGNGVV